MAKNQRLTTLRVTNAKPKPDEETGELKRTEISDGGSGLYLVVQPSGRKSWAVRFRVNGIPRKLTLDASLTLAEAREQAATAVKEAQRGTDPTKVKKQAKQAAEIVKANTFAAVALKYLDSDKTKRLRSFHQNEDWLKRLAFPLIGDRPIAEIKRSEIATALDHIEHTNGPVAADRVLGCIRCVFNFHCLRDDDFVPPLAKGMERTSRKDRARDRTLTDDEIRKVWATGDHFVRFLLLTGARRTEAAGMQWKEIVGKDWTLPAIKNKAKVDLIRPLSKAALAVLPTRGHDDEFVFGAPDRPLRSFTRLKANVDKASGVTGWRLHDARRTARTLMSRARVSKDYAEQVLGHVLKGIHGNYDKHDYYDEKKGALEALAKQIKKIVTPPKPKRKRLRVVRPPKGENVIQLQRA
jgi:integrase